MPEGPAVDSPDMCEESSGRQDRQLFDLIDVLGNSLSLHETLYEMDVRLRHLIRFDDLVAWLPRDNSLTPGYVSGEHSQFLCAQEIRLNAGTIPSVAVPGQCLLQSTMAVPLENNAGLVGVLAIYHHEAGAFQESDQKVLLAIRRKATAAVTNALRYERAERLAAVDPESFLLNERALFLRLDAELARARRNRYPVGVLVCDVGRPPVGWPVVANGVRQICREDDCLARMGQSLVLVLVGFARPNLREKHRKIAELLAELGVAASIGAAFYPDDGAYADDLLALAGERRTSLLYEPRPN